MLTSADDRLAIVKGAPCALQGRGALAFLTLPRGLRGFDRSLARETSDATLTFDGKAIGGPSGSLTRASAKKYSRFAKARPISRANCGAFAD